MTRWASTLMLAAGNWLLRIAFLYCSIILVLMALEDDLVYPNGGSYHGHPGFPIEEIWLATEDGERLHAWFCPGPKTPSVAEDAQRPVALFCHGNGGELSSRSGIVAAWQQFVGVDVFIFDYRGYGKSTGSPTENGLYRDSRAAYAWLTQTRGIDPRRIVLAGESLGGAIAIALAESVEHRALVIQHSFGSLPEVAAGFYSWLPVSAVMRNRFPSIDRIGHCRRPMFQSHGERDSIVPFEHGMRLHEAANAPKHFLPIKGMEHNDSLPPSYYEAVRAFVKAAA